MGTQTQAKTLESDIASLSKQIAILENMPNVRQFIDGAPEQFLVLNSKCQIVFANHAFQDFMALRGIEDFFGRRPGECFQCEHAVNSEQGCGASEFCKACGSVKAVRNSLKGKSDQQEFRITTYTGEALELRITTYPIEIESQTFCAYFIQDISHEKRRLALERTFFHDIGNTITAIQASIQMLKMTPVRNESQQKTIISQIILSFDRLIEEFQSQRELTLAENEELVLHIADINCAKLLDETAILYHNSQLSRGKDIIIEHDSQRIFVQSDKTQLLRILSNMTKNALEASKTGQSIILSCKDLGDDIELSVKNETVMSEDEQLQVFTRSFSTKGQGRGQGTYSMKLLGERYLMSKVSFESNEKQGTIFSIKIPKVFPHHSVLNLILDKPS